MTRRGRPVRAAVAAVAALALIPLGACSDDGGNAAGSEDGPVERSLTTALAGAGELSRVNEAVDEAGLAGVFQGAGSYTVLAPTDAAFDALGDDGQVLTRPEGRAVLVAILRDHVVPGHLMPEAIRTAIERQGGPVEMRTLGEGTVAFSLDGERIAVTGPGGVPAHLSGEPLVARNGVVLPVDALLKQPPPADQ